LRRSRVLELQSTRGVVQINPNLVENGLKALGMYSNISQQP
jgi:hypothetical protein